MTKYKCGLYIGRFQPLHIGHTHIISKMLDECEKVIIAIGSAQESGTKRNPLSYAYRKGLIMDTYFWQLDDMIFVPLKDREHPSDDASWGDYVMARVKEWCKMTPDVIYEGEEEERNTWYDNWRVNIERVPRTDIPVSATRLREAIKNEEYTEAVEMLPAAITYRISDMRRVIQNAEQN